VPDDRILKSEAETGYLCMCLWASILDMVEIERSFPVKGETPVCSKIICFLVSFHLKTGYPLPWDHMLCISSRVNAVAHCMLAKHADTFTHVSRSIRESRLWLEKNALSQPCLVYSLTNTCTNTQSPLLISKSYHQALLSGIFLSVKAY
jgi:hypothetical protein